MRFSNRTPLLVVCLFSSILCLRAQTTTALPGHWEGKISAPFGDVPIQVDLVKNAKGELAGTFSQPEQKLKGLALASVSVEGSVVSFEITGGAGTFDGSLLEDGKSIAGGFMPRSQVQGVPFSLTRTGDARIEAPPKSPPIGKEIEGVWDGALKMNGGQLRILLTMSNQSDGTSMGRIVSVDEGGIESPVAITQKGASLSLDVPVVGASWSGALNGAGTELAGTYTTADGVALPLTFGRAVVK